MKYAALAVILLCISCSNTAYVPEPANVTNIGRFTITSDDTYPYIRNISIIKDNETGKEFACFHSGAYASMSCVITKP
jgi:hypothetical protein